MNGKWFGHGTLSVIVDDFYIVGILVTPNEADTVLIVDADAVLAPAITLERFKSIARRNSKVVKLERCVENGELLPCRDANVGRNAAGFARFPEQARVRITDAYDHYLLITQRDSIVKR